MLGCKGEALVLGGRKLLDWEGEALWLGERKVLDWEGVGGSSGVRRKKC